MRGHNSYDEERRDSGHISWLLCRKSGAICCFAVWTTNVINNLTKLTKYCTIKRTVSKTYNVVKRRLQGPEIWYYKCIYKLQLSEATFEAGRVEWRLHARLFFWNLKYTDWDWKIRNLKLSLTVRSYWTSEWFYKE